MHFIILLYDFMRGCDLLSSDVGVVSVVLVVVVSLCRGTRHPCRASLPAVGFPKAHTF